MLSVPFVASYIEVSYIKSYIGVCVCERERERKRERENLKDSGITDLIY